MRQFALFLILIICILGGVSLVSAQETGGCAVNNTTIVEQVGNVCQGVGANQICYGNHEVDAVPYPDVTNFSFEAPGALTSLSSIQSLFLKGVDPAANTWGIAQVRMLVNQGNGTQDVTMLLFGDVNVENKGAPIEGAQATVISDTAQIFPVAPSQGFPAMRSLAVGTVVTVFARLANNLWVRIQIPETGEVGWVFRNALDLAPEAMPELPVEDGSAPHYGPMQAFTYQSGTSPNCGDTVADGLLIQTPQGVARVSFLINEVAIELTSSSDGASAFVQANPDGGTMNINVLGGTAYVNSGGSSQQVDAGTQTSIPITGDLQPFGAPTSPQPFNADEVSSIPVLSIVRDPLAGFQPESNPLPPRDEAVSSTDTSLVITNTGGSNSTGSSTGTGNGGGQTTTQGGNPQTNSNGSGDGGINLGGGNDPENNSVGTGNPSFGTGSQQSSNPDTSPNPDEEPVSIINVIILVVLVIGGLSFVGWLIWYTRRSHK
jgi:hypothetical protein